MAAYLFDWTGLLLRWLHVVAGVAWIGASFYFVWLDNHLQPLGADAQANPDVAGEVWAVHGGGFYRSQKYRVSPAELPPTLHWFYWEAYTTWLSGFALLSVLYFARADAYLIDPAVAPLTAPAAVAIGLAMLLGSWLIYDGLCRSALARSAWGLGGAVGALLVVDAWILCHVFSGRGAFMLFGSSLGTIMVANVLFVIIPGQRELVRAKQEGRAPDAAPGLRGKQRSVHNTYFTLPVIFVMISNHYAMTYGAAHNWLVLIEMSVAGAGVRAWFVMRHKRAAQSATKAVWRGFAPVGLAIVALATAMLMLAPRSVAPRRAVSRDASVAAAADDTRIRGIVAQRCVPCHAATPTQAGFNAPPNGLSFESLEQVRTHLAEIQRQVSTHAMPLGNLTGMTEAERGLLLAWIEHGGQP